MFSKKPAELCQFGSAVLGALRTERVGGCICADRTQCVGDGGRSDYFRVSAGVLPSSTSFLSSGSAVHSSQFALSACVLLETIFAHGHAFVLHNTQRHTVTGARLILRTICIC